MLLTVLIPAYEYPEGVKRILEEFINFDSNDFEVIVSDDSESDRVKSVVNQLKCCKNNLLYIRNRPSLGGPRNWNQLVRMASGEFCLLIHHDEFPIGSNFIQCLLETIKENRSLDVFMADCILVDPKYNTIRRHLPKIIRFNIIKLFPSYILRRGLVGPISTLIIRRNIFYDFDDNLQWFVDVDLYYRLRLRTNRWLYCNKLLIGSELRRSDSITTKLQDVLDSLKIEEIKYLRNKYTNFVIWLNPSEYKLVIFAENLMWNSFRIILRFYAFLACALGIFPIDTVNLSRVRKLVKIWR